MRFSAITSLRATARKSSLSGVDGSLWADRPKAVIGHGTKPLGDTLRRTYLGA